MYAYYSIPRGELLFFKKPKSVLSVEVKPDQDSYQPGDLVTFEVTVQNLSGDPAQDSYVSVVVTDDSAYSQVPNRLLPPSRPA